MRAARLKILRSWAYVLFKEVIDNAIDEFMQGFGKTIEISIKENKVSIRDYGRGIPLTKVVDCVSKMNTGGKFKEGTAFDNSIGMNGVGVKAVNALSTYATRGYYQSTISNDFATPAITQWFRGNVEIRTNWQQDFMG